MNTDEVQARRKYLKKRTKQDKVKKHIKIFGEIKPQIIKIT
jgi:hypothetical protein